MLERLTTLAFRNRWLVSAVFVVALGAGFWALLHLEVDAFPDTTPVQVQINTVAPELAPEEVEVQISFPIESSLGGLPGLVNLRSVSKFGFSQVVVTFDDDSNILDARQLVMERLGTVRLPEGIAPPELGPISTGLGEVFHYLFRSTDPERSLEELRTLHETIVVPELRKVRGVAEVNTWGGFEKQYQVVVDPAALLDRGLTLPDILTALEENNRNAGGGTVTTTGEDRLLVGVAKLRTEEDIARVVVESHRGVPVLLRDVAAIQIGHGIRQGAVTADGQGEAVLGLVFMLMGENSREVTRSIRDQVETIRPSLPPDVELAVVYDRTDLVDKVIRTVKENLLLGAGLVVATLFLLFGSWRAGLLIALAIPFSFLLGSLGMRELAIAASLLSLGAMDFGILVDGSVVMAENVLRRLGDRSRSLGRALDPGERFTVVLAAGREVARPVFFGTAIIAIVLLPVLFLGGVEGKLFRPMALTFGLAMVGALLVAVLWMPALSYWLLPRRPAAAESRFARVCGRIYTPVLERVLRRPRRWILGGVLLVVLGGALGLRLGGEFVPRMSEGSVVFNFVRLAGISIQESVEYNTRIERLLLERFPDEIEHVWSRIGTAEVATDPMGTELTDTFVALKPRKEWKTASSHGDLVERMQATLADLPGQTFSYTQPIEMRMNEMLAGIRTDFGVKIYGEDLDELARISNDVQRVLGSVRGAANVSGEQLTGQPVLRIQVVPEALARSGIPAEHVLRAVEAVGGIEAGEVRNGPLGVPLVVRLPDIYRKDPRALPSLILPAEGGSRLPLASLVRVEDREGPSTVTREWARRRTVAQCNIEGRDIGSFVAEAQRRVREEATLPRGYTLEWSGRFEQLEAANARFAILVPATLLVVFLLLLMSLRRLDDTLLVFTGIPFAAVGGVFALAIRGLPFSVSAAVGFIALSGIAVLNGQVLVSTIRRGLAEGLPIADAVRQGGRRRLRAVLATAITDAAGFLPMALSAGVGAEVQRPLATVVIGGVTTSTILTLLVLPALFLVFARNRGTPGAEI